MSHALLVDPCEGYRLWAATFDRDPSAVIALETRTTEPLIPDWRARRVVDVGCGTGRWTARLSDRGAEVWGFDVSSEMLARAAEKPGLRDRVALGSAGLLPLPHACADGVICALTLGHLAAPESAVREFARVARPGAVILLSDFHPDAARRGWKRTFRASDEIREIETHAYDVPALLEFARVCGLDADAVLEPGFGEPERRIFVDAGRESLFEQVYGVPAVLVVRWRKRWDY